VTAITTPLGFAERLEAAIARSAKVIEAPPARALNPLPPSGPTTTDGRTVPDPAEDLSEPRGYSPGKQPSRRPSLTFAILVLATYRGPAETPRLVVRPVAGTGATYDRPLRDAVGRCDCGKGFATKPKRAWVRVALPCGVAPGHDGRSLQPAQ
jgi:hypothetical protein